MVDGGVNIVETNWGSVSGIVNKIKKIFYSEFFYQRNSYLGKKNFFLHTVSSYSSYNITPKD